MLEAWGLELSVFLRVWGFLSFGPTSVFFCSWLLGGRTSYIQPERGGLPGIKGFGFRVRGRALSAFMEPKQEVLLTLRPRIRPTAGA